MESIKDMLKQIIAEKGNEIPAEAQKPVEDLFINIFDNDMTPREAMGFGQDILDFAYQHGYKLFEGGKYEEALPIFLWLRMLEPLTYRYVFSVAACYHYLKDYDSAFGQYLMASMIDPENPEPDFYASDCCLSTQSNEMAVMFLEKSLAKSEGKPEYNKIHETSLLTLNNLKQTSPPSPEGEKK